MNPLRANMVATPSHYRWSSYRSNAQGKPNNLITPHRLYTQLGRTKKNRQEAYKSLFKAYIDTKEIEAINAAWLTGTPLGNERFKQEIEKTFKRKVGQARRGRPTKKVKGL